MKKSAFAAIIISSTIVLLATGILQASEDKLVALSYAAYWTSADNQKLIAATKEEIISDNRPEMRIVERDGQYLWASNNDLPLIRTEKVIKHARFDVEYTYSVFTNPDGEGIILIRHDLSDEDGGLCHQSAPSHNYAEYRLNGEGKLTGYFGSTRPSPWPKPHKYCGKPTRTDRPIKGPNSTSIYKGPNESIYNQPK